jgi:PIN like domain
MAARAKRSKRPSAASSGSKLPERLVFFIDRSLGKKIVAQALRKIGETVEIHDDHFAPDAKDEDWLAEVGKRGWIVLTKDDRIRYRVTERTALTSSRVRAFVLTSSQLHGAEMAAAFVNALPRIKRLIAKHAPPFICRVSRSGNVSPL